MTPLDWVLRALRERTGREALRSGDEFVSRCPAHDDTTPSLSIRETGDGRVLLHCFAGCPTESVVHALGGEMRDLMPEGGHRSHILPEHRAHVHTSGLTVEEYAAGKRLPVDFLSSLSVCTVSAYGRQAVRIPYLSETGEELSAQLRLALDGTDRFRWRKGSKPVLYGQNRLGLARELGYVVLVEGASDVQTLWLHGRPAIGIPGANAWREARDAELLADIPTIYVVVEPDQGGDRVLEWLAKSAIAPRAKLLELRGGDVSALYLDDTEAFPDRIEQALQAAPRWSERERFEARRRLEHAGAACRELAGQPDILAWMVTALRGGGVVGEARVCKLVYLALTTRLLDRPVSIAVKGVSSGGKSYLMERVVEMFPPGVTYELSAMSEHALAYDTEPMQHRFLVVYEAAGLTGDFASYLLRSLLSEGRIKYLTVEKVEGKLQARLVEREGPTGLMVTTTALMLHPENETRILSVPVDDTREQTAQVMVAQADHAETGQVPAPIDLEPWHALQEWMAGGDTRVIVPYAKALARLVPPVAVRLRRDFPTVLALVKAHALLHRASRDTDGDGRILATIADYAAVRDIAGPFISAGVEAAIPDSVRETVAAVAGLEPGEQGVSIKRIAEAVRVDPSACSRRVRECIRRAHLRNLETSKGRRARIVLGEPLSDDLDVLPPPERVHDCTSGAGVHHPSPSEDIADLFARMVAILSERTANGQMSEADATAVWHQSERSAAAELRRLVEDLENGS